MKISCVITSGAVCTALSLASITAHAGGYATARFGGEHGHAATDHPTALYYNPAGLALGKGTRIYAEGLLAYRSASYDRPVEAIDNLGTGTPDTAEGRAANSGKAELSNVLVTPFLGAITDLGIDGLAVGGGFYVPFGGQAKWGTNDQFEGNDAFPGALDGPQRWSTIEGSQRVLYATAAGAYRLSGPRLSFGVGLNLVSQSLSLVRARNANGSDDLIDDIGQVGEGRSLLEGSDTSVSVSAGVLWEASERVRVGLSYQSIPGFGESSLSGSLTNKFGSGMESAIDTELLLTLPDSYRLGVVVRPISNVEIRLAGDYTRWSVFERQCVLDKTMPGSKCAINDDGSVDMENGGQGVVLVIPRDWQDTFGVRAGGSFWLSSGLELFGGVGFDSNAAPDETLDSGLMDMNKVVTSVGVRYDLNDAMQLTGSATNVFYATRETPVRETAPLSPSLSPDTAGTYKQSVSFLTVGLLYGF